MFLKYYNEVTMCHVTPLHKQMHLDASLQGQFGGQFKNYVFSISIPLNCMNYNIAHFEMVHVVVDLKIWGHLWVYKRIEIFCDNRSVVDDVLSSGRARDHILATCARNVWLLSAMYNISIMVLHFRGSQDIVADLLSRWWNVPEDYTKLHQLVQDPILVSTHIDLTLLNHNI